MQLAYPVDFIGLIETNELNAFLHDLPVIKDNSNNSLCSVTVTTYERKYSLHIANTRLMQVYLMINVLCPAVQDKSAASQVKGYVEILLHVILSSKANSIMR